eukprot:TRINITY_DN6160_c0_g1_i3.p1 TRINITY_DN6160_c0_g1~~TRINITY_DN6160_c0_g1_i3.p1  ORF type:complete len:414 (+),score=56.58 TRINITY_DN6160_c0_g1_i3:172-1242(+)
MVFLMGVAFGVAFDKSRVFVPQNIQDQFIFKKFMMIKMFLAAVATGQLALLVVNFALGKKGKDLFQQSRTEYAGGCERGLVAGAGGAALLGAGMAIAGACPGMVLTQVGTGVSGAWITLIGCLLGAFLYGTIQEQIHKFIFPLFTLSKPVFLDTTMGVAYNTIVLYMSIALWIVVAILEYFVPWRTEVKLFEPTDNLFAQYAWPPQVGGAMIGALQLPAVLVIADTLGSTTGYQTLSSQWINGFPQLKSRFQYFDSFCQLSFGNWWQVMFMSGAVAGAMTSGLYSGSFGTEVGVGPRAALIGGMCMVFGARLAGGCTSGHGISGTALLAKLSLVATPAMFVGAIGMSVLMKALNFE